MAAVKYKFNPENLLFERIRYSFKQKFIQSLPVFILVSSFSFIIMFFGHDFVKSPRLNNLHETQSKLELQLMLMKNDICRMHETIEDISYNDDYIYRTYFEVDPLPGSLRKAGSGGHEDLNFFVGTKHYDLVHDISESLDILAKKAVVQSYSFDNVIDMAKNKEKRLAARPAIQPVSIKDLTRFGSPFGMRLHPILKKVRMHEGIDFTCPRGTKIFTTADGIVLESGYSPGGLGIRIFIDHGYGYKTIYGHLEKVLVKRGDHVKRGEVIGLAGSTGLSTCPHLHYEIMVNGRKVNPVYYYANDLTAEEYDKMINLLSNADPAFDIN